MVGCATFFNIILHLVDFPFRNLVDYIIRLRMSYMIFSKGAPKDPKKHRQLSRNYTYTEDDIGLYSDEDVYDNTADNDTSYYIPEASEPTPFSLVDFFHTRTRQRKAKGRRRYDAVRNGHYLILFMLTFCRLRYYSD